MCTRTRFKLVFLEVLFSYMFGQYSPILPQLLNDSHVESRIFSSSSNTATKVDLSRRIPAHIFFNCFSRQFPGFPDCQNDFQQASHRRSRAPQKSWKRVCFHRSCLVNVRSRSKRYEFGLPRRSTNLVGLGEKRRWLHGRFLAHSESWWSQNCPQIFEKLWRSLVALGLNHLPKNC